MQAQAPLFFAKKAYFYKMPLKMAAIVVK